MKDRKNPLRNQGISDFLKRRRSDFQTARAKVEMKCRLGFNSRYPSRSTEEKMSGLAQAFFFGGMKPIFFIAFSTVLDEMR